MEGKVSSIMKEGFTLKRRAYPEFSPASRCPTVESQGSLSEKPSWSTTQVALEESSQQLCMNHKAEASEAGSDLWC